MYNQDMNYSRPVHVWSGSLESTSRFPNTAVYKNGDRRTDTDKDVHNKTDFPFHVVPATSPPKERTSINLSRYGPASLVLE